MYGYSPYAFKMVQTVKGKARAAHGPVKGDRLEARVTPEQKQLIVRAAALRGSSVTEFIVASAQEAAAEAIRNSEILALRDEARDAFVHAILHPPRPNEAARKAMRRYRQQSGR
jgi:uncharacterized protein (DUF1778 family)